MVTEGNSGFAEQAVADYLGEHPEFLIRRPDVLLAMTLGHSPGERTTSLVPRLAARLWRSNAELETRIEKLSARARSNDALAEKIHRLTVTLLPLASAAKRIEQLRISLRRDFSVDRTALILFSPLTGADGNDGFVQIVDRRAAQLRSFVGWLDPKRPRCGPLLSQQRDFAFGASGAGLESAATVPLGEDARLGYLVMASQDPQRFNRAQHVDFLRLLGDVIAAALVRGAELGH